MIEQFKQRLAERIRHKEIGLVMIVDRGGRERLHRLLVRLDPASAARVHPGDRQRLVRALELALDGWKRPTRTRLPQKRKH